MNQVPSFEEISSLEQAFAIQLSLVEESRLKEFGKCSQHDDISISLNILEAEIKNCQSTIRDAKFAKSIDDALRFDIPILSELPSFEEISSLEQAFAIQLSLVEESRLKEFGKCSQHDDISISLNILEAEMKNCQSTILDAKYAKRMDDALRLELPILSKSERINHQAQLEGFRQPKKSTNGQSPSLTKLTSLVEPSSSCRSQSERVNDAKIIKPVEEEKTPITECLACHERGPCYHLDFCQHNYCRKCIQRLCEISLKNRFLIPLRCCKHEIPDEYIQNSVPLDILAKYSSLKQEVCMPVSDELKQDDAYKQMVSYFGWKLCPKCGIGVERIDGCTHMTCPCGHEFCYQCCADFKPVRKCNCDIFTQQEIDTILDDVAPRATPQRREALREV
jgi:hypothetical protein